MDADLIWMVLPGLATGIGGLVLLVLRNPTRLGLDVMLGFTAGVMLAATAFSLLVPALEEGTVLEVLGGFALGSLVLLVLDVRLPHGHAYHAEHGHQRIQQARAQRRGILLLTAMTIHNVPEGLAVGVAFAAGGPELGAPIAIAIGLQNVPEGFASAAPLLEAGWSPRRAARFGGLTGLVEPPAALAAYGAFELAGGLLPIGLGFAAGAMLYVVVDELVPESHGRGNEREASIAFLLGFAVMLALDNAFG